MRSIGAMLLAIAMVIGSGCATPPDWIDRTLVTVDVTGTWFGRTLMSGVGHPEVWLDLNQEGPRVKGFVYASAGHSGFNPVHVPIQGTIAGDVFSFRQTNGNLAGEMKVSGDDMTGEITDAPGGSLAITLWRVDSSPRPSSPKP